MAFETIGTAADRVIYSAQQQMAERAAEVSRAKALTNAAIRNEAHLKKQAQLFRQHAVSGSLHALAKFIALADQHDDAVIATRASKRREDRIAA